MRNWRQWWKWAVTEGTTKSNPSEGKGEAGISEKLQMENGRWKKKSESYGSTPPRRSGGILGANEIKGGLQVLLSAFRLTVCLWRKTRGQAGRGT